ncbi:MAG: ABC transporter ATP-binding protein [Chloroflexota bacterium]|nr:ABC transporter ATP-binding protein [Chloroflexota bacterium]
MAADVTRRASTADSIEMQPKIIARGIGCTFAGRKGRTVTALHDLDLTVAEGEFVCLVGPSGCGKSTFLRIVAGLLPATAGELTINSDPTGGRPQNNVVFQEYALFPWKTALDNVAFGLEMRGIGKKERIETARQWLAKVGLTKFEHTYPYQLSGGMRQRVGIARAFANDPDILLMDEPLGALDAQTKLVMQEELLRLWEEQRKTVLYITHSLDEATLLGDRVVLMTAHPGTIKETFDVPFIRPRTLELTSHAAFGALTYTIWQSLKSEVKRAMEQEEATT